VPPTHSDDPWGVIPALRRLHVRMQSRLRSRLLDAAAAERAAVDAVRGGDVIYRIDTDAEHVLVEFCEAWSSRFPFLLIAEGISESGSRMFPLGAAPETALFRLIVDPIDGTRGLMYDKRSAWILSAVAPNRGDSTSLQDIRWAVMTEAPTSRARYADQLWATAGQGTDGVTWDLIPPEPVAVGPAHIAPSGATDLRHGFAGLVKYFPGGKAETAELEEALFAELLGEPDGTPLVFDDQYISNGGQLREILAGHDRFVGDLRPLILPRALPGELRLCAHPYDLCCVRIAEEAGVVVTDARGQPLDAPLDVHTPVAWVAYANEALRGRVEPVLQRLLRERGLL